MPFGEKISSTWAMRPGLAAGVSLALIIFQWGNERFPKTVIEGYDTTGPWPDELFYSELIRQTCFALTPRIESQPGQQMRDLHAVEREGHALLCASHSIAAVSARNSCWH